MLPLTDVFFPNGDEALTIAARRRRSRRAARRRGRSPRAAPLPVVKCGADGAAGADGALVHAGAPAVGVVDTVGAGDSFDAGFLSGRLTGSTRAGASRSPSPAARSRRAAPAASARSRPSRGRGRLAGLAAPAHTMREELRPLAGGASADRALLRASLAANRAGEPVGIYSSARPTPSVLEAAFEQALRATGRSSCVESTCNQVNQ